MPKPQVVLETRTRNKKAENSTKPPVAAKRFFGAKDAALLGRTSERQQVPVEEYKQDVSILVPSDIISVKLGDVLPADARLFDGDPLKIAQSTLTGESFPVTKDPSDSVYSGLTCKQGEIEALVIAIGIHTFFGKVAHYTGQDLVAKFKAGEP